MIRTVMPLAVALVVASCALPTAALCQSSSPPSRPEEGIRRDADLSHRLLEPIADPDKVSVFVAARREGAVGVGQLLLGASFIALIDRQTTSHDSKFSYLTRHPTAVNQVGRVASEAVIHSLQVGITGSATRWVGAHAELLYDPQQSFGTGTITALARNQIQVRRAFVLVGDPARFPAYAAVGKMDAPFSLTSSVSPFSNSTLWHAFAGLGFGARLGVRAAGLDLAAMAIQGGAQFRSLNTPVGAGTAVPSRLNNVSVDVRYRWTLGRVGAVTSGASYLRGSAYCQDFPVLHFGACKQRNPALSAYGRVEVGSRFVAQGAFARTRKPWPGTRNPTPPLDAYAASRVRSLSTGARLVVWGGEGSEVAVSGEFSNFRAGPSGAPWERQNQTVVGVSGLFDRSTKVFAEYVRTAGYAPLNFLSGGNLGPGETHSVRDASGTVVLAGVQVTF